MLDYAIIKLLLTNLESDPRFSKYKVVSWSLEPGQGIPKIEIAKKSELASRVRWRDYYQWRCVASEIAIELRSRSSNCTIAIDLADPLSIGYAAREIINYMEMDNNTTR